MPKNIVIFSDGTGQRGGILVDERRSNIYKLYRATRCGPDSTVDPAEQLAFYDPGIGTLAPGAGGISSLWRRIYNLVSQALGLGLTRNMIACYAAIVQLWRPGDKIFLFGFSRGAYTIRCLAAVICKCGVPTRMKDGTPLRRDDATVQKIASEAVKYVYQHTSSWVEKDATPRQLELLEQRKALAARFREQYGAADGGEPNVYPYFIGVFDTVASLSDRKALAILIGLTAMLIAILSWIAWFVLRLLEIPVGWSPWFAGLIVAAAVIGFGFGLNFLSRIRVAFGLKDHPWYRTLHLAEPRMKLYDKTLDPKVGFARHAISIDEARSSFQRVGWGWAGVKKVSTPEWFEQFWFAGCHSDIGGGYEENGSRLSDISLQWMLDAACSVGLKYDPSVLRLHPDPSGPQHDEAKASILRFAGTTPRRVGHDFTLHPSVIERFKQAEVLNYDTMAPYRPENLRGHDQLKQYY
jgi:uncharacterized protein (DUF2235 family)